MLNLRETILRVNSLNMEFTRDGVVYQILGRKLKKEYGDMGASLFTQIEHYLPKDAVIADIRGASCPTVDILEGTGGICTTGSATDIIPVKEIHLPNTVRYLDIFGFYHCQLEHCVLPESVTYIGRDAFEGCEQLQSCTLPDNITTLHERTFHSCKRLKEVHLPANLMCIEDNAFFKSGIEKVTLPPRVHTIGRGAFSYCNGLTEVKLNDDLQQIGACAFYNTALTKIVIPKQVKKIGQSAFSQCPNLREVHMPYHLLSDIASTELTKPTESRNYELIWY